MKATVCIYDSRGMPVRQLANTILSEPQFTLTWDGTTDSRLRAPSGIYIIFLRVADNIGNTRTYKKPAVLAIQF